MSLAASRFTAMRQPLHLKINTRYVGTSENHSPKDNLALTFHFPTREKCTFQSYFTLLLPLPHQITNNCRNYKIYQKISAFLLLSEALPGDFGLVTHCLAKMRIGLVLIPQ